MDWDEAAKMIWKVAHTISTRGEGHVKLGYACNNKCLFCTAAWKKPYGDRDTQTIMNEVKRIIFEDGVFRIVYSGGDPTVRNDLPEILRHAKRMGIQNQNIQTNGRRLGDRRYLEALRDAGLTSCFVSIHGPEPGIHEWLTQAPGSFDQTYAGLVNLDRLGMKFTTNTVVCKQNYRSLSQLVTLLGSEFGSVRRVKLSYPRLQGGAYDNLSEIIAPLWEVAPFIREAIDRGNEIGVHVLTEFVPACLNGTSYDRADDFNLPRISLSDLAYSDSNWCRPRGQVFYEFCDKCDLLNVCFGIEARHHEAFGEHPCFTPVSFAESAH